MNREGRSLSLWFGIAMLLAFMVLTAGFRAILVAPHDERISYEEGSSFAIVWEAWRTLEQASAVRFDPTDDLIEQTIILMTRAATDDVRRTDVERVMAGVDELDRRVPSGIPDGLEDVWRAWQVLQRDYPDASVEDLTEAARRGLIVQQDTAKPVDFLSESQYEDAQTFFTDSSYEGIGASVRAIGDAAVISEVFLGGPAEMAGLQPGDQILTVNGVSVDGSSIDEIVKIVKGEEGTEVVLEIQRPFDAPGDVLTYTIVRDSVPTSLEVHLLNEDAEFPPIGYIRIQRFHSRTGADFRDALQTLLERDIEALVLDMRSNPGGALSGAVDVISEFVPAGLAMYEITNDGERIDWNIESGGLATDIPVAVLVNGYSASAAEVVAGALKDHDRASLYGRRTYGKGSVQVFQELSDGSALYVTVSRWHTPSGRQFQSVGIAPDYLVTVTLEDHMLNRDRALISAYVDLLEAIMSAST